ncbi:MULTISPECIES: DUF3243 domain-containing protein [Brevibacillus]|jgi:hypothetical protein|uniref:DUF3243 domain-containing protein n=1 Tax=Brevibacillus borstelensis AK1 TaxID=1300222 RepID=M8EF87_9BACL|nr:DUF3243 domain-containing protein [Brevibacillus borstelensis]EMT54105.1 hypothetical protein I532_00825 [Brevibacillus borstelensis AK1]KKX53933.1 hypothetical protein X546_16355 [Brevibacillus borstelensis cifa_chp40]MBE5397954.1 DUF3243 domain-containing protein [Brevibacillus borstelensis]MCC0563532.1 DUF3243 domain-containing protein [Brevibacillus borstelensis]MCM3469659.1 DUF3243 domain-containing protein [Brevibacillus borstelensis]
MSVLDNFRDWKAFLGERVEQAKQAGMESDTLQNVAYQIGGYLAEQVDPKNDQERLLKQLWDAGDEEQQKALASLMVKLVQDPNNVNRGN